MKTEKNYKVRKNANGQIEVSVGRRSYAGWPITINGRKESRKQVITRLCKELGVEA